MAMIVENQLAFILAAFLAGCIGAGLILRRPAASRAWKVADLLWVILGGFGAVAAVLAGLYRSDTLRVDRQIDLAYAASRAFDLDAARFRLRYCDAGMPARANPQVGILCDKVEFLQASTARNRDLPLFLEVARAAAPLQGLGLLATDVPMPHGMTPAEARARADTLATTELLAFDPEDAATDAAVAALARPEPDIAAGFRTLALAYGDLIAQVGRLKDEWDYLRANRRILALQVIALGLIAFAAPFRIGKSVAELRQTRTEDRPKS